MPELQMGMTEYFEFYNTERPHQSLGNSTPHQVYQTASGGGARIVDKFIERKRAQKRGSASQLLTISYHHKLNGFLP